MTLPNVVILLLAVIFYISPVVAEDADKFNKLTEAALQKYDKTVLVTVCLELQKQIHRLRGEQTLLQESLHDLQFELTRARKTLDDLRSEHDRLRQEKPAAPQKVVEDAPGLDETQYQALLEKKHRELRSLASKRLKDAQAQYKHIVRGKIDKSISRSVPYVLNNKNEYAFPSLAKKHALFQEKKYEIQRLEKDLNAIRFDPIFSPLVSIEVGKIGTLQSGSVVQQIINKTEMIVVARVIGRSSPQASALRGTPLVQGRFLTGAAFAARARRELNAQKTSGRAELWLQGVSTKGLADGAPFKTDMVFEIIGTKQYETTMGATKTVFLARPYIPNAPSTQSQSESQPLRLIDDVKERP